MARNGWSPAPSEQPRKDPASESDVPTGDGSGPRLLIYSQDGMGLGHLRRTSSLANQFLRACPDACVLTISDSPLGTFFGISPNQDYLKLPSIVKTGAQWHPFSLPIPGNELLSLRRDIIASAALSFRPDLVLVDHMPHGARGELLPALEALRALPTKVVLGLRDILDAPHVVRESWQREGAYDAVERHYDLVLVYGSQEVFDVAQQYRWHARAASRLRYCGYVCTPETAGNAKRIRTRCLSGARDAKLIVAMAGGGADAYPLMDSMIDVLPSISAEEPCALIIVTGPFMPPSQRRDLQARAQGKPVQVRQSVHDAVSYIGAADVVVAMAGYNTTAEVLRAGKAAVLVPRAGPSAEQRMRAQLFAERGWVGFVDPDELSPKTLGRAVRDALGRKRDTTSERQPDLNGLGRAVRRLTGLVDQRIVSSGPARFRPDEEHALPLGEVRGEPQRSGASRGRR